MHAQNSGRAMAIGSIRPACSAEAQPWAAKGGCRARLSAGLAALFLAAIPCTNWAAPRYVSRDGTNDSVNKYITWAGAATNIQDAMDAAQSGETIWVSNGVYKLTADLSISNACTLRGFLGRDLTIIDGQRNGGAGRTVRLWLGAILDGITVSNAGPGALGYGQGVYIAQVGHIRNAKITRCARGVATGYSSGSITNSIITQNDYSSAGGGIYNLAGFDVSQTFYVSNCVFANNTSVEGGGVYINSYSDSPAKNVIYSNCMISNNAATNAAGNGGGGVYLYQCGILRNCLIISNQSLNVGGGVTIRNIQTYAPNFGQMVNCTIAGNSAASGGGGVYLNGTNNADSIISCVVYANFNSAYTAPSDVSMNSTIYTNAFLYSCMTNVLPSDRKCITSSPQFVGAQSGNYRLGAGSPCINAGTNQSWQTNAVDLDMKKRIRYDTVDMGAYERLLEGTVFRFH